MSARGLLALDCPRCGAPLPGLDADIAFACPPCGAAWEVVGGRLEPVDFRQLPLDANVDAAVNLPAWRFPARISASPRSRIGPTAIASALAARAAELRGAYVLAATLSRADVFGDWGRDWTRIQPEWSPPRETRAGATPRPETNRHPATNRHPLVGATLPSADARHLAEHTLLAELDRVHDLGDVDVALELGVPTLLAVPAVLADSRLRPLLGGVPIPLHALDDGSGILKAG